MPSIVSGWRVSSAMPPLNIANTTSPFVTQYASDFVVAFMVLASLNIAAIGFLPHNNDGRPSRHSTNLDRDEELTTSSSPVGWSKSRRLPRHTNRSARFR
jgi:hypothetical protein